MSEAPENRHWFRFSIRELALMVLAIGFALAWREERTGRATVNIVNTTRIEYATEYAIDGGSRFDEP
jgi:hypothetical protein